MKMIERLDFGVYYAENNCTINVKEINAEYCVTWAYRRSVLNKREVLSFILNKREVLSFMRGIAPLRKWKNQEN